MRPEAKYLIEEDGFTPHVGSLYPNPALTRCDVEPCTMPGLAVYALVVGTSVEEIGRTGTKGATLLKRVRGTRDEINRTIRRGTTKSEAVSHLAKLPILGGHTIHVWAAGPKEPDMNKVLME